MYLRIRAVLLRVSWDTGKEVFDTEDRQGKVWKTESFIRIRQSKIALTIQDLEALGDSQKFKVEKYDLVLWEYKIGTDLMYLKENEGVTEKEVCLLHF